MKNDNIVKALESCKAVLIDELRKYVEAQQEKEVKCWIKLPVYTDDTYGLDGYWVQNTVTRIFIDKETDILMADFEDYDEEFQDPVDECFDVGEIASIIDHLD